jgi:SOS response regulatory protein OraA/RecX
LTAELRLKGIDSEVIEQLLADSGRNDESEIQKVIAKKRPRYPDDIKLMAYLARLGFSYDDIKVAMENTK